MSLIVGIDTGGTYTDAVLFDPEEGVLATAKSLTTKHDLSIGLGNALEQVIPHNHEAIDLVSISTTLATNAVVEGHTSPVGVILIGFDEVMLKRGGLAEVIGSDPVGFVDGGHTAYGKQKISLDIEAATKLILEMAGQVSSLAIAGLFAVRNAEHEIAIRDLARELTDLPVTCSHELSSKLDAPKRALTTVLNARLIPQLQHLIKAVTNIMADKNIKAQLMVVKGDGSLEDAQLALRCPVETILSGPAASLVGAHYLSKEDNGIVVDMGGTTTDIALMHDGMPLINEAGASVGGRHTMVEAVSIHTFGLGGDSEVSITAKGIVNVGPRRVMPISLLADLYPQVLTTLEEQLSTYSKTYSGQFAIKLRSLENQTELSYSQQKVWDALGEGPVALWDLQQNGVAGRPLDLLVNRGLVIICGFTPSDAMHVLAKHKAWSQQGAVLAAKLWLRKQPQGKPLFETPEALCLRVLEQVTLQSSRGVLNTLIAESCEYELDNGGALARQMVDWYLEPKQHSNLLLKPRFEIDRTLVAIGAPAANYYPAIAERLQTRLLVPEHAQVANAVGAATAGIMQIANVLISRPGDGSYRVHIGDKIKDIKEQAEAYTLAEQSAREQALKNAEQAGAVNIEVTSHCKEKFFHCEAGTKVILEARLFAKALGRPNILNMD